MKISGHKVCIAVLAGISPLIIAFILASYVMISLLTHKMERVEYLLQHQDVIVESLIVSSVFVAVLCTVLRNKTVTFLAACQPVVVQATFLLTDLSLGYTLKISLAAMIVLPVLILLKTLISETDQANDQDKEEETIDTDT